MHAPDAAEPEKTESSSTSTMSYRYDGTDLLLSNWTIFEHSVDLATTVEPTVASNPAELDD